VRVLVTGYSGFTGRYVAASLADAGYDAIDAERGGRAFDLTRPESIAAVLNEERPDHVIHLAALSFVGHGDSSGFYAVNTVGTTNLLEALLRAGVTGRVLIASSANVYGNAAVEPITEDTPAIPVGHYAASKLAMEHMVRTYADRLPIVITRPFNYSGIGQPENFLIPKLVAHFVTRAEYVDLGNVDVVRDFSDVRAIAEAYVRLLRAQVPGSVTNLCSGVGRSLRWVIDQLAAISGHELKVHVSSGFVRANEVHRLVGSPLIMREALGELPFADFRHTLRWMLEDARTT